MRAIVCPVVKKDHKKRRGRARTPRKKGVVNRSICKKAVTSDETCPFRKETKIDPTGSEKKSILSGKANPYRKGDELRRRAKNNVSDGNGARKKASFLTARGKVLLLFSGLGRKRRRETPSRRKVCVHRSETRKIHLRHRSGELKEKRGRHRFLIIIRGG